MSIQIDEKRPIKKRENIINTIVKKLSQKLLQKENSKALVVT